MTKDWIVVIGLILLVFGEPSTLADTAIENRLDVASEQTKVEGQFLPHRGATSSGHIAADNLFENAQVCGSCHQDIYQEWQSSIMANAWEDPIYRALLKETSIATQGATDNFCSGCHSPVGLMSGRISQDLVRSEQEEKSPLPGVDCEACHRMSAISGLENGSYVLDVSTDVKTKYGPRSDASSPYHNTQFSPLHTQSKFCASCHNVSHPFNELPIERTYDEWYESSYRTRGIECQDCHMTRVNSQAAIIGPVREDRITHNFAAANTTILKHFGYDENAERARDLLRSSATLAFEDMPDYVRDQSFISFGIKVLNSGAGHKLPTGFPEGREIWLDMQVTDAKGTEIYRLGAVKDGKTEAGTRNFKVHLGDSDGQEVDIEVWRVDRILSDNRIMPMGHALEEFQFYLPRAVEGPITISARLNYWPFSQALADRLLGEGKITVDIEQIAEISQQLLVSE